MKIAIFGAGGIGSLFGGMLARSGHEVALVCRGAHLQAIRSRGLKVRVDREELSASVFATQVPAEIGPVDYVLNCVKLYDITASAVAMAPLISAATTIVTTQNGVCAAPMLSKTIAPDHLVAGAAFSSAHVVEPGVVVMHGNMNRLQFGELQGGSSDRVALLEKVGQGAGLRFEAVPNIQTELWKKFALLNALSLVCCLTRQPVGVVQTSQQIRSITGTMIQEASAVASALGVMLPPTVEKEALAYIDASPPDVKVSMLDDLLGGRRLELEWLAGDLCQEARLLGVSVPVTQLAYEFLRAQIPDAQ
jgi:2-dehydropantoate 2-reductase